MTSVLSLAPENEFFDNYDDFNMNSHVRLGYFTKVRQNPQKFQQDLSGRLIACGWAVHCWWTISI